MATDTVAPPAPRRTRPDPTRRLWQVPVFLLGLTAFVAEVNGWLPLTIHDASKSFRADLAGLRAAAEKHSPDAKELAASLARVAGGIDSYPQLATVAHFYLGSGYVKLAELTADPGEARGYWALARQHFDAVRAEQLTEPNDDKRLEYRAAKARAADPSAALSPAEFEKLRTSLLGPPLGDDPCEGFRLLADLSLRLTPPDLRQAKESLTAFIAESGLNTSPAALARAKLRLSQIHLDLRDQDGAKMWLGKIGPDAPPDVLPVAKAQLARIRMAEHDWTGAAGEWEQVRAVANLPAGLKTTAAYHLGVCKLQGRPADDAAAAKLFAEAAKSDGPEAPAARVRLAALYLRAEDKARHEEAVGLLTAAVKGVGSPADYPASAVLPIQEVQAAFELAVQVLTADGAFDAAVRAAGVYKVIAAASRDREKRAEALAAWGVALEKQKGDAAPKLTAAAEEYVALAELRPAVTDQADQLRRAAGLYRQAGKPADTVAVLERVIKLPKLPDDLLGPAWVEYAEGLLAANRPDDALKAFMTAMNSPFAPASTTARYRVARLLIDSRNPGNVDLGVGLMDQIARAERVEAAEQGLHERALAEAGYEYLRKGNYAEAEARLRKQLKLYPAGGEAGLGKLLLGTCLLLRADPKAKPPVPEPVKSVEEALKLCREVVADVDAKAKAGQPVGARDKWLRVQALIRVLRASVLLSRTADVLAEGDKLRWEVAGTVDELIVLSMMYSAYDLLKKPEGKLAVRGQMKEVFDKLRDKPGAFPAKTGDYSREYWETVWFAPDPGEPMPPTK